MEFLRKFGKSLLIVAACIAGLVLAVSPFILSVEYNQPLIGLAWMLVVMALVITGSYWDAL